MMMMMMIRFFFTRYNDDDDDEWAASVTCYFAVLSGSGVPDRFLKLPASHPAARALRAGLLEKLRADLLGHAQDVEAETSGSVGWQNFGRMFLVFGCIGTDFCNKICVL